MKILLSLFLFLTLVPWAQARLGETLAQVDARFGPSMQPFKDQRGADTGLTLREYQKHGFIITVLFSDVSVDETYQARLPLSERQIKALLTDNDGGFNWKKIPSDREGQFWKRDDGAIARLNDKELEFKSKFILNKEASFKKTQQPSVKGF
jgi:hypothetical protein